MFEYILTYKLVFLTCHACKNICNDIFRQKICKAREGRIVAPRGRGRALEALRRPLLEALPRLLGDPPQAAEASDVRALGRPYPPRVGLLVERFDIEPFPDFSAK